MEQRKVFLSCGPAHMYPVAASVGLVVTSFAIEMTTVVQFANVPRTFGPWLLHFPVQTANGHLVQCGVLHNTAVYHPSVMFHESHQTVCVGPCSPVQNTLVFTLVIVYVPSFQQSFIAHLHLGTPQIPCVTSVKVRNLMHRKVDLSTLPQQPSDISVQVRTYSGSMASLLQTDCLDKEWSATQMVLSHKDNFKLHVYLMENNCFGISEIYMGQQDDRRWILVPERDDLPKSMQSCLWVLKPRAPDNHYLRFYAAMELFSPPPDTTLVGFEELVVLAARIICKRETFFKSMPCLTMHSDADTLSSLGSKVSPLDLPDYRNPHKIDPGLLDFFSDKVDWSWRTEMPVTPHINSMIACLDL